MNVIVRESAAVFELLAGEDQTLLVRRDALLVLNLRLHVLNRVRRLDVERDRLASQSLDEDLCVKVQQSVVQSEIHSDTAFEQPRRTVNLCQFGGIQ